MQQRDLPGNVVTKPDRQTLDTDAVLRRYPRICAHIICASLGYALPSTAASILKAARDGNEHWCEWIASCYRCNPRPAVEQAIRTRHSHRGYMAHYPDALAHVQRAIHTGQEPLFASWF
jgi:hypothetical protein